MRPLLVLVHRWIGLAAAAFLFVAGATGAVISWDHELDDLLNAHLTKRASAGPTIASLELARRVEAGDPRVRVTYVPLAAEDGKSVSIFVQPRVDPATGLQYDLDHNQVFLDPVTGTEIGRRKYGAAWPITRETFVSFLYVLHYSLHIPEFWGIERWGLWLMGTVAALWALDCFVGLYLTLPVRRTSRGWWARWKPAWRIKTAGSAYRINFDIHRASGLWTWALLLTIAFTGFSLGLYREVFVPVMSLMSEVTPSPFDMRTPTSRHAPIEPRLSFAEIVAKADAERALRGWTEPVGAVFYTPTYGVYGAMLFQPGDGHGAAGVGPARLYYDGLDGRYVGDRVPWRGTVADIFVQAQFPLHSGRILGLPGRILISLMGIVVAALSVTGVVIWWRKRRARLAARRPYRLERKHLSATEAAAE